MTLKKQLNGEREEKRKNPMKNEMENSATYLFLAELLCFHDASCHSCLRFLLIEQIIFFCRLNGRFPVGRIFSPFVAAFVCSCLSKCGLLLFTFQMRKPKASWVLQRQLCAHPYRACCSVCFAVSPCW